MSELHNQDPYQDLEQDPALIASEQVRLANEWANIYANPDIEPDKGAEIILRNPSIYLDDVERRSLPEDLQLGWQKVEALADQVAESGATEDMEWGIDTTGLGKVQSLVFSGRMNPMLRGSVADIMRISSGLLSESMKHAPGRQSYYAGNVRAASGWLTRR